MPDTTEILQSIEGNGLQNEINPLLKEALQTGLDGREFYVECLRNVGASPNDIEEMKEQIRERERQQEILSKDPQMFYKPLEFPKSLPPTALPSRIGPPP